MIQILVSLSKMKFRRGLQLRMAKTTVGSKQMWRRGTNCLATKKVGT